MSLATNKPQRIATLCALYFAQGLPWGFATITLVNFLSANGISTEDTGKFLAVILLPWSFKLVWAPFVDAFTYRAMGRRRPWIIFAQFGMVITLLATLYVEPYMEGAESDTERLLHLLYWMLFIHNVFQSLQDVSTDALAVDILPESERGLTNGLMWASQHTGTLVGALVFSVILADYGLRHAILLQVGLLIGVMMFPLMLVERTGEKRFPWSRGEAQGDDDAKVNRRSMFEILRDLKKGFSVRASGLFPFVILMSSFGWGVVDTIIKTVCNQELGWDPTDTSALMGQAVYGSVVLALLGGWIGDKVGRRKMMALGLVGFGIMSFIFGITSLSWGADTVMFGALKNDWITATFVIAYPGLLSLFTVNFLVHSMQLSWTKSSATMFTIFMAVVNLGRVIGNYSAGPMESALGIPNSFVVCGLFTVLCPLLFFLCDDQDVKSAKERLG